MDDDLPPASLAGTPVFTVGSRAVTWADVVSDARRRGAWAEVEGALSSAQAEGKLPPAEAKARAADFRYARNLVAGEEMEAWLAHWGLTVAQWMRCIRRTLRSGDVWVVAVCSGALARFAHDLAGRLAVHQRMNEHDVETSMRAFRHDVTSGDELTVLVQARALDWTRIDADVLSFAHDDAAREAVSCLTYDGLTPTQVAAAAGVQVGHTSARLEDLEPPLRAAVLGSRPGDVVGPVHDMVTVIRDRVAPAVDDPDVRHLAEEALVARAIQREIDDRVVWHVDF